MRMAKEDFEKYILGEFGEMPETVEIVECNCGDCEGWKLAMVSDRTKEEKDK